MPSSQRKNIQTLMGKYNLPQKYYRILNCGSNCEILAQQLQRRLKYSVPVKQTVFAQQLERFRQVQCGIKPILKRN